MKRIVLVVVIAGLFIACKDVSKTNATSTEDPSVINTVELQDTISKLEEAIVEVDAPAIKRTKREVKAALMAEGFKVYDRIDSTTQDTIIMQQYFMVFLKNGPIRGQNEEEITRLQTQHEAHLKQMYTLGYADVFGSFAGPGEIQGVSIYNVPNIKMVDSLARLDPMVKAGHFEIEIHPWWAEKGTSLR